MVFFAGGPKRNALYFGRGSCYLFSMKLLLLTLAAGLALQAQAPLPHKTNLKVGDSAHDFKLRGSDGKFYTLSEFKGKKLVVLAFFPAAFTGG